MNWKTENEIIVPDRRVCDFGLALNLGLGAQQQAAAAPAASLTFEWKIEGGSYAEMTSGSSPAPGNLSGKQLFVKITSADVASTVESITPRDPTNTVDSTLVLAEDGDGTGEIAADGNVEIAFDMATDVLARKCPVQIVIDGTTYTFTFKCFQFAGTLRAVNSGATATTGITVDGVDIGDASAGYATLDAAIDALANTDVIVITEAFTDTTQCSDLTETGVFIDVADSARGDNKRAGSSTYLLAPTSETAALRIYGTGCVIRHLHVKRPSGAASNYSAFEVQANTTSGTYIFENCIFQNDRTGSSGYGHALAIDNPVTATDSHIYMRNCVFYNTKADGGAAVRSYAGEVILHLHNCDVYTSQSGVAGIHHYNNLQLIKCANCRVIVPGTAYYANCLADASGAGNNMGSDTSAPGTTAYDNATSAVFTSVTAGSEDFHWPDSDTMDNYAGADMSASYVLDIDSEARAGNHLGCDYVTA